MIHFHSKGDFENMTKFLKKSSWKIDEKILDKYGSLGVTALSENTPRDSGKTASSWSYRIKKDKNEIALEFYNSNTNDGVNIALILQYGHATRNHGWVEGRDYINPALRPIFDKLANDAWKEVINT